MRGKTAGMLNWRRNPQPRVQRAVSPLEIAIGVISYAKRLQTAAETLIAYFTPMSADEIKTGERCRRGLWWRRRHTRDAIARRYIDHRRHVRSIQKRARRIRAARHPKSGRAA